MPDHSDTPTPTQPASSLNAALDSLQALIKSNAHPELSEMNTLSAAVQKLVSAYTQLKSLELKVREADIKQAEIEERREQLLEAATRPDGLTPETLREIERQLKLL